VSNEALVKAFAEALAIAPERINGDLAYNSIEEWDSTAHMALVAAIEQQFGVMLQTQEVLDLSSFDKAKEILCRHGIRFEK